MVEEAIQKRVGGSTKAVEDMTLDELDEIEDEADEKILLEYRFRQSVPVRTRETIISFTP